MAKQTDNTGDQAFKGGKVSYSEVESPSTSLKEVAKVAGHEDANLHDNPSGNGVPSNKDYYPA